MAETLDTDPVVTNLRDVIQEVEEGLSEKSKVDKLFIQYIHMHDILFMNLHAERLGNWEQYIKSLKLMLPYFVASGHRNYTRSVALFIQEMETILDDFTKTAFAKGEWVIRRADKPYAAVSVDLAIEQSLMSFIKGNQGLTRGR